MSKHKFDLTVTLDAATEGGKADPEDLSDRLYEALTDAISEIVVDGEAAHHTREGDYVEFSADVAEVKLYEGD